MLTIMLIVFLWNWLFVPHFKSKQKSMIGPARVDYTRGFFVGLIAALLVFIFYWLFGLEML